MTMTETGHRDVRAEQWRRREWGADAGWGPPEDLHRHMSENTNQVAAARAFAWERVLGAGATVLDLGCGSGWLAGILSAHASVERVIAWDGSPRLLDDYVPPMVELVAGEMGKIERVCGDFSPLLLDDASVDVAVMASAFHHAERPHEVLEELHRVVRPGGAVVLLNEVPHPRSWAVLQIGRTSLLAARNALVDGPGRDVAGHVASDHLLYDDTLGDRAYTPAQWRRLFARHPFTVETIDSGLPPYPASFRRRGHFQPNLHHFLLRRG